MEGRCLNASISSLTFVRQAREASGKQTGLEHWCPVDCSIQVSVALIDARNGPVHVILRLVTQVDDWFQALDVNNINNLKFKIRL